MSTSFQPKFEFGGLNHTFFIICTIKLLINDKIITEIVKSPQYRDGDIMVRSSDFEKGDSSAAIRVL